MAELPLPLQFLGAWIGTWVTRHQERSIAYLKEENRVLLKKLGGRARVEDPERRRLGRLGKDLGRKALQEIAGIATPRHDPEVVPGSGCPEVRWEAASGNPGRPRKASRGR